MKPLIPSILGLISAVLALSFFLSDPISRAFFDGKPEHSPEKPPIHETRTETAGENELEKVSINEIRLEKKTFYETVLEELEIKESRVYQFLSETEIKDENILEQIPAEKPAWIFEIPADPEKQQVYFLGESYGTSRFEEGMTQARTAALIELCQFIKLKVDHEVREIRLETSKDQGRKLIKQIVSQSKNTFMRESRVADRFYSKIKREKGKPPVYHLFVLVSYPKKNVEAAVKEGLLFELEQMKAGASAAELEKIQAALKNLEKRSEDLSLKQKSDRERAALLAQMKPAHLYLNALKAENLEKEGKLLGAYREYAALLKKLESLIGKP